MMKTQTLLASLFSGLLILAPVAKADHTAEHKTAKAAHKKGDNKTCECGDCKKGKCAAKKCEHCHHEDENKDIHEAADAANKDGPAKESKDPKDAKK